MKKSSLIPGTAVALSSCDLLFFFKVNTEV